MRVRSRVRSTSTLQCFFAAGVLGGMFSLGFGPVAGMLVGLGGLAFGLPACLREAREEADALIGNGLTDEQLRWARMTGKRKVTVKTELKHIHPRLPPLGRLLFGDKLSKETTYYLDDD